MQKNETPLKKILNKNVFVVGGTGMLGKTAINHLLTKNYNITTICLPPLPTEDSFNGKVNIIAKNVNELSDTELLNLMSGNDYMVIATGADERVTPKAPALDYFRANNVNQISNLLRLARLTKVKKIIILGSYFTYFNNLWPELELTKHHPYIKSRVEQMEIAFTYNSNNMNVVILEIPYIFGTIPTRTPLSSILKAQLNSHTHIYYPTGGTAMATAQEVAEAIEGAFLYSEGGKAYPIASVNLKWKDFLAYLLKLRNQKHKKMTPFSKGKTVQEMKKRMKNFAKEGNQHGLDLVKYLDFQKRDAFIDPVTCMNSLKYTPDDLHNALQSTLSACTELLKK